MALTILNNIAAIAAQNQLNITSNSLQSTLEQLSSGSRINSGADDPAGLLSPTAYRQTLPHSLNPRATPPAALANCR
jgi:flagellin-like hook-associated protein FlgL